MEATAPSRRLLRAMTCILGLGLLILSWCISYIVIMALTEGWGAPWDTAPVRPPDGYWQRELNDFFESGIGVYVPTVLFMAIGGTLYARTLLRTGDLTATSFVFGATTSLSVIGLLIVTGLAQPLFIKTPGHLTPDDWSYWGDFRREWPLSLVAVGWFASLWWAQPRMTRRLAAWLQGGAQEAAGQTESLAEEVTVRQTDGS